jgi:hypothetical protein
MKLSELDRIVYRGMEGGLWKKGLEEREAGNYETAADNFNQLATTGAREWEKVYGAIAEGECWELVHKPAEAAKAFALVVDGYAGNSAANPPILPHRLWLDAKYRMGMALAQAGKSAEAAKIANDLEKTGRDSQQSALETRAWAIRTALAAAEENAAKFQEYTKKANFRSFDEKEAWFHFKLYCADTLRLTFKKEREAVNVYREIRSGLGSDPVRQAQVSLGLGLCLMASDRDQALIELFKLDLLPYGSADQKCEARFNAGRMVWDQVQIAKANSDLMKDEAKANYIKSLERTARLLVTAATEGPAKNPNLETAKALLQSMGPDPDAPKPANPEKGGDKPAKPEKPAGEAPEPEVPVITAPPPPPPPPTNRGDDD